MSTGRAVCSACGRETGQVTCEGCSKIFCEIDFNGHRQELETQLNRVEGTRNEFRQTLTEITSKPQNHALIEQINEWENRSINTIRQAAEEARQKLLNHIAVLNAKLEDKLNNLTIKLRQSRKEKDLFEPNLNQWTEELVQMKDDLTKSSSVTIRNKSTPLVTKITVDIRDEQHGKEKHTAAHAVMKNFKNTCTFCEEQFMSEKAIRNHLMLCGNKTNQCGNCGQFVRRAIFAYHIENNCTSPDEPTIVARTYWSPQDNRRALALMKCEYCNQNYERADSETHKKNCVRNPLNGLRQRSRSSVDVNFDQNTNRSHQSNNSDDNNHIPCELCGQPIPLRFYEQHVVACYEKEYKRTQ